MPKALITGISGQDGSYLAELLLKEGYEVHGLVRRASLEDPARSLNRLQGVLDDLVLHAGSLESHASLFECVRKSKPDELYHLGAQSFVSYSFEEESSTMETNLGSTHSLLSAVRQLAPDCRFYFACSSEAFGRASSSPQNEQTPFNPRSIYGISKVAGFHLVKAHRENHGLRAASGILFNHESPRRGREFVTRKITSHAAAIQAGKAQKLLLGNLDARRDWGHARDYVKAMVRIARNETPRDYVIATGQTHSVREFCELAFAQLGLDYREHVQTDERFFRPSEPIELRGDSSKAERELEWRPETTFSEIIEEMTEADVRALQA